MRILAIRARAFGPLQGKELQLRHGMNVICGPNEAGKSSWHAALYAGLCGMRRGRGAPTKEDREFTERHTPWSGDEWKVEIDVELQDGRRVQISQNLANLADCKATDLQTGRDLTAELDDEGTPDGAKLLGLSRKTLPATIFVRQADMLRVLKDAQGLQDYIQRAASTGRADETAERAIVRLETFRSDSVGTTRSNSTKPLRRALDHLAQMTEQVEDARRLHARYLLLVEQKNQAIAATDTAESHLKAADRALAFRKVESLQAHLARVDQLAEGFPEGEPEVPAVELERLGHVREVLAAFNSRPAEPALVAGATATDIEVELQQLLDSRFADTNVEPGRLGGESPHREFGIRKAATLAFSTGLVVVGSLTAALGSEELRFVGLLGVGTGVALLLAVPLWYGRFSHESAPEDQVRDRTAQRRRDLEQTLASRRALEASQDADRLQRHDAEQAVREIAAEMGVTEARFEDALGKLRSLMATTEDLVTRRLKERENWARLRELLGDKTREELAQDLASAQSGVPPDDGQEHAEVGDDVNRLAELEAEYREGCRLRDSLDGQIFHYGKDMLSVSAAEEAEAHARKELDRLRSLGKVVERTLYFMTEARDRVQRDIAPRLASSIQSKLPTITAGRYQEALVDPTTLEVRVRSHDGEWRQAKLLSHGTKEQIYLLARFALAEHLVTIGESAPLVFDDVTVQFDATRTIAFLDLLRNLSEERQIIVFSQEPEVVDWGRPNLAGEKDLLVELEGPREA